MLYHFFETFEDAEEAAQVQVDMAALYWQQNGETVQDDPDARYGKVLLGRNQATGEVNPQGKTIAWDIPKEAADGSGWYLASLGGDPRFVDWKDWVDLVRPGYVFPEEQEMQAGWLPDAQEV